MDQNLQCVAAAAVDTTQVAMDPEFFKYFPMNIDGVSSPAEVLRTGNAVLHTEISDVQLKDLAQSPEQLSILRNLNVYSLMIVPLTCLKETIGVLVLISTKSERHFDKDDLALAEEFARRAANALENARLYAEAQNAIQLREDFISIASHELENTSHFTFNANSTNQPSGRKRFTC